MYYAFFLRSESGGGYPRRCGGSRRRLRASSSGSIPRNRKRFETNVLRGSISDCSPRGCWAALLSRLRAASALFYRVVRRRKPWRSLLCSPWNLVRYGQYRCRGSEPWWEPRLHTFACSFMLANELSARGCFNRFERLWAGGERASDVKLLEGWHAGQKVTMKRLPRAS